MGTRNLLFKGLWSCHGTDIVDASIDAVNMELTIREDGP
jgi:hypothetical protein